MMGKKYVIAKKDVFCEGRDGITRIHTENRSYEILSKGSDDRGGNIVIPTDEAGKHMILTNSDYFEKNFKPWVRVPLPANKGELQWQKKKQKL